MTRRAAIEANPQARWASSTLGPRVTDSLLLESQEHTNGRTSMTTAEHRLSRNSLRISLGLHQSVGWCGVATAGVPSNILDWNCILMLFDTQRFVSRHRVWRGGKLCAAGNAEILQSSFKISLALRVSRQNLPIEEHLGGRIGRGSWWP